MTNTKADPLTQVFARFKHAIIGSDLYIGVEAWPNGAWSVKVPDEGRAIFEAWLSDLEKARAAAQQPATLQREDDPGTYDEGITYAIVQLAELTASKDWQMRDGSEDHATDVRDTIMDVLKCAGLYDDETGKFAVLSPTANVVWGTDRAAIIDECAKVCGRWISSKNLHEHLAAMDIAAAIRALAGKEMGQ